jgi:hypothetical protein
MAYDTITPAILSSLNSVKTTPGDSEAANQLGKVDRQTRAFVYDFLAQVFSTGSSPKLLVAAVDAATVAGKIGGSGAGSTQKAIVQGSVGTLDLADDAVTAAKIKDGDVDTIHLANGAVETAKLNTEAVTANELADNAVTEDKILDGAVTEDKLGAAAVVASKLDDDAVETSKIKDEAVTLGKLADSLGAGRILVSDSGNRFADVVLSGDATMSSTGVLSLNSKGVIVLHETLSNTVACGSASATTWHTRGYHATDIHWVKQIDSATNLYAEPASNGRIVLKAGTYIISASAPAYAVGLHKIKLEHYLAAGPTLAATVYGSSEVAPATPNAQTRSFVQACITIATSGDFLLIKHYTTDAVATSGLGFPTSAGGNECYAQVFIQKL